MVLTYTYSPQGFEETDRQYFACCHLLHITTAARLIAVITSVSTLITVIAVTVLYVLDDHNILDQPIGIAVFALTILICIALVYGVFALKRFALIPYLVAMGVMISLLFVTLTGYMLTIACTEYVDKQFRNEQLRQFYQQYGIDPDNEFVRYCVITLGALLLSLALLIHGYFWLIIFGCYRFLALRDAARLANERGGLGYLKDSGMDDTKPFDEA